MPNFIVSTLFKGANKLSPLFNTMGKSSDKFGNRATKNMNKVARSTRKTEGAVKSLNTTLAGVGGVAAAGAAAGAAATSFVAFDDSIIAAASRFKDIGPGATNFAEQLFVLKQAARAVGATTEFSATQAAEGLDFLAKAGFRSVDAIAALKPLIDLTTASGEDFAATSDRVSDLVGALGLNIGSTAERMKNLTRLTDVLAKATNTSNVTVETLFETLKQAGPVAKSFSSVEEVAAMSAVLGDAGLKGEIGGTALKRAFLGLASPTSEAAKLMRFLGVQTKDVGGNLLPVTEIFEDLRSKIDNLGTADKARVLETLFGKVGIAGGENLLANIDRVKELTATYERAGGAAENIASVIRTSLGNQLKVLLSTATDKAFEFFGALRGEGQSAIQALTEAIRRIDVKPLVEGFRTGIEVVKGIYGAIRPLAPLIPPLIGVFIAFNGVMKTLAVVEALKSFFLMARALRAAAAAQGILNAVMLLSPIGLVVAAIAGLVVGAILIYRNWDKVKEALLSAWEAIKRLVEVLTGPAVLAFNTLKKIFGFGGKKIEIPVELNAPDGLLPPAAAAAPVGRQAPEAGTEGGANGQRAVPGRVAPNQTEIDVRQEATFRGLLDIAGAPAGSELRESQFHGLGSFDLNLMGAN